MNQSGDAPLHTYRPSTTVDTRRNNSSSNETGALSSSSIVSTASLLKNSNNLQPSSSSGSRSQNAGTLPPKRRHGRLHKMGLVHIDERMEQRHQQQLHRDYQDMLVRDSSTIRPFDDSTTNSKDNSQMQLSKSLPSLQISVPLFPPLRQSPASRDSSPHFPSSSSLMSVSRTPSSRPGTTPMGFGSAIDRKMTIDTSQQLEKKHSIEELHHLDQMMNPNRPRTSSVKVQIKRYLDDVETLERNSKLSYANASASALKANFTYSGSLDTLQETFKKEAESFDSVAIFAQSRYLEMISYDGSDREPTKFKAALSADLMMKLVSSVSRYGNIMRPLLWELLNCIFVDYERVEERFMHDPNSLMLKELVRCPTYLELAHQLHDRLEEMTVEAEIANRGMQMKSVVKKFQTLRLAFQQSDIFIRDACFMLWKGYHRRHQQRYRIARKRGLRYRFRQWRQFMSQANSLTGTKGEDLSDKLDAKIHRLMALNQNLLKISEQQVEQHQAATVVGGPGALVRQATRRNICDDRSPQIISHILSNVMDSDSPLLGATPRQLSAHYVKTTSSSSQGKSTSANTLLSNQNAASPSSTQADVTLTETSAGSNTSTSMALNSSVDGGQLSPADRKRVQFFMPGGNPLESDSTLPKNPTETPDSSRLSTAASGDLYHSSGTDLLVLHGGMEDIGSPPDTPELMEFSRHQASVAAQKHNIPEHLLTRPPPNAARAIMRHRAVVVGGNHVRHNHRRRRHRVPQQDVGVQANAEDFNTVDLDNHKIMLSRANNTMNKSKARLEVDGDDFDHNQYMVVILSPRDQHETHVGNVTTQSLSGMTHRVKLLHRQYQGITPTHAGVNTKRKSDSIMPETAAVFLSTTLSMDMVIHLIGSVYEHLFCHFFYDPNATSEVSSVLFSARDVIYRRYQHDRILGKTIFKEFIRGCLEYVALSKRIEVFCKLSGLIPPDIDDIDTGSNLAALTDEAASINKVKLTAENIKNMSLHEKLHFFILMLSLWSNNIPFVAVNMLLTSMIDREIVLQHIPDLFPSLEHQNTVYNHLVTTIIDLPCYHAETLRLNHFAEADKIDLDVVCDLFLRYEQPERLARHDLQAYLTNVSDNRDEYYYGGQGDDEEDDEDEA